VTVIFSKKCELALQAILYLSTKKPLELKSASEIAAKLKAPKEFVAKILQTLALNKIIESRKGKSGGFYLKKPANQIRLIDIVLAIDGLEIFHKCVLGFPTCSTENPCPIHEKWGKIRDEIYKIFSETNLEDVKDITLTKISNL